MEYSRTALFGKAAFFATSVFSLFFITTSTVNAQSTIRVSGFSQPRNYFPLTGFVVNDFYEEDPVSPLREELLDPNNFGPNGKVACSVDLKPLVNSITPGSLVSGGQRNVDVFFAGLSNQRLTSSEANELANFIRAGGITYVSAEGYSSRFNIGLPGFDGANYNPLFSELGVSDSFSQGGVFDLVDCGWTTTPSDTAITNGVFGSVGEMFHEYFQPINVSSLQRVANGFGDICFVTTFVGNQQPVVSSLEEDEYFKPIIAEGKFGNGYLSVTGTAFYKNPGFDEDSKNYYLNLFAKACGGSVLPDTDVEPFLDLPWDYGPNGTNMSFSDAALSLNAYFDHEYPLISTSLSEPAGKNSVLTGYSPSVPDDAPYTAHDGYDWGSSAKTKKGVPVLAAASGTATFKSDCGACGNAILIDHGNGFQTRYYHLMDEGLITNKTDEEVVVTKGQKIGQVGFSGNVIPKGEKGAHLHFMVVEDKDGDGDFSDNIPDGIVDPFGWQSIDPDPWETYSFTYKGEAKTGNKSYYLWTKPIANLSKELSSNSRFFELERYGVSFSPNTQETGTVSMKYSPIVKLSDLLEGIGSVLQLDVFDSTGSAITSFPDGFSLTVDFSNFDLSKLNLSSLSIYSSNDGILWTEENTQVDIDGKAAISELNHASFFVLAAERLDTTAPSTLAGLSGDKGEGNWFRSDVSLTLTAQDNEGGLGVDYILYGINGGEWQEYTKPVNFNEEGSYTVDFYAVDNDDNIEETKSVSFSIDKKAPEIKIMYDPQGMDTKFIGVDENDTEIKLNPSKWWFKRDQVLATDPAGNQLTLEGRFGLHTIVDSLAIERLKYNNEDWISQDRNLYTTIALKKKNLLSTLTQSWLVSGQERLLITYNSKTDKSYVFEWDPLNKWQTSSFSGLKLLIIQTENGNLKFDYE